ncbi:MAG: class I SAM-dependent methyltransferase, partial [Pseudomonadota bacterium]
MGPLTIALDDPELKKAPAAFRAALSIARDNWDAGSLTFVLPSGRELRIEGRAPGPDGRLVIRDFRFVGRVLASADIGFGEGFVAGEWDTPDLSALLEAFTLNFDRLRGLVEGNPLMRTVNFLAQLLHRNSRRGARRNIHAHYDLGNAFYARWLDPSMTYSSARYERPGQSLGDAQHHKYASLARDIGLEARHHILEIGCGWGGFAEFAAREVGARVTGVTISPAQHEFARKRLFDQGLADRADI